MARSSRLSSLYQASAPDPKANALLFTTLAKPPCYQPRLAPAKSPSKCLRIGSDMSARRANSAHESPASSPSTVKLTQQLISNFSPTPFQPLLSANPHFQTIVPHFFPRPTHPQYTRCVLPTDDGLAHIHVDIANGTSFEPARHRDDSPVAVIVPGMESNSRAAVTRRLIHALYPDFKVFALNFRSCGGTSSIQDEPETLRLYHAGFTDDLETVLLKIRTSAVEANKPPAAVYLCGFSLGANILMNFLGKWGSEASSKFGVVAACAAAVPFNPAACSAKIDSGFCGAFYASRLARGLRHKFLQIEKRVGSVDVCDRNEVIRANRIGLIDDALVAPVFHFDDRFDYYRKVDVTPILKHVSVPTLVINARDDPFFDHASGIHLPSLKDLGDAPVRLHVTEHGGHCGFLDWATLKRPESGYFQREFVRWFRFVRDSHLTA